MSVGEAAEMLGVTVKTLQRWEREGRLIPHARTPTGRCRYTEAQLPEFLGIKCAASTPRKLVAYRRVSSAAQKPDLATSAD